MPKMIQVINAVVIGNIGILVLAVLPGLLGEYSRLLTFTDQQLGYLASADLAGLALGTLLFKPLIIRFDLRKLALVTSICLCLLNVVSAYTVDYLPLVLVRCAAGVVAGSLHAIAFCVLGSAERPERNFGLFLVGMTIISACALLSIPVIAESGGIKLVFFVLAGTSVVAAILSMILPRSVESITDQTQDSTATISSAGPLLPYLVGIFAVYSAGGAYWAYMSRIGEEAGFSISGVSYAAAATQIFGLAGASIATLIGKRMGYKAPLYISLFIMLSALAALVAPQYYWQYFLAIGLLTLAWNFSVPLNLALVAKADLSGGRVIYAATLSNVGLAFGPAAAATFITQGNLLPVLYVTGAFAILSVLVIGKPKLTIAET